MGETVYELRLSSGKTVRALKKIQRNKLKDKKKSWFSKKTKTFGGDKRDRTADLLNAIGLLCKLTNIYTTK